MATRKKTSEQQSSLFAAPKTLRPLPSVPTPPTAETPAELPTDTPVIAERKVRLVHSVPESDVIVEPDGNTHFVVSLLRDHGTRVAAVRYSRKQLEMLAARAAEALAEGGP